MPHPFIHLDIAAGEPPLPEILDLHTGLCRQHLANPHANNAISERSLQAVRQAERRLLALLGIAPSEAKVVWTSGGTEANALALAGWRGARAERSGRVAVDATAHASQFDLPHDVVIPVDAFGQLQPAKIDPVPEFASICQVNNETGVVQDLALLRQAWPRAILAVDALQSFTRIPIPWREARIDLLSLGGRKFGAPAATGALVVRQGVELRPPGFNPKHQQGGLRPGTLDVVGILEMVAAAEIQAGRNLEARDQMAALNQQLRQGVLALKPAPVILSPATAIPQILAFAFPGFQGAVLARALAERNILVGTGAACAAESAEPSRVALAMGLDERIARGMLRVSFAPGTGPEKIAAFLAALQECLARY